MTQLPVAEGADVRRAAAGLVRTDRRSFAVVLGLNALAALAGLAGPWLLGRIVDEVRGGGGVGAVDRMALAILLCSLAQLLLARWARYVGHRFGERTLARVRERYVERALALPASVVERAGSGDLTTRGTADVTAVGTTLRDAGPELLVNAVQALFLTAAVFVLDPLLGLAGVLGLTPAWIALRWYLRRARAAYLAEGAANSDVAESLAAWWRGPARSRRSGWPSGASPPTAGRWRSRCAPGCGRCSCAVCSSRRWTSPTSFPWRACCCSAGSCTRTGRRASARWCPAPCISSSWRGRSTRC